MKWTIDAYKSMSVDEANRLTAIDMFGFASIYSDERLKQYWRKNNAGKIIAWKYRIIQKLFDDFLPIGNPDYENMVSLAYARCVKCNHCPKGEVYNYGESGDFYVEGCFSRRGCDYATENHHMIEEPGCKFNEKLCPYYEPKEEVEEVNA